MWYLVFITGHSGGIKKCHEPAAQTYCRKLLVVEEGERESVQVVSVSFYKTYIQGPFQTWLPVCYISYCEDKQAVFCLTYSATTLVTIETVATIIRRISRWSVLYLSRDITVS